ncbi:MAG TPA: MFS transporter [Anaerolineae bacterium]
MAQNFRRDSLTWLTYALISFYGYFLNVLGPITPFLQDELKLSYTVASLHFTAFGVGILLMGLGGHRVIQRLGAWRALWTGALGLSGGVFALVAGRTPWVTIAASFVMGLIGSLILVLVPALLADHHGDQRAVALTEANTLSSFIAAIAALLAGWSAQTAAGWRLSLIVVALTPAVLRLGFGRAQAHLAPPPAAPGPAAQPTRNLPLRFWVYWVALVLGVSVEFCMISWSAGYLEKGMGLPRASAAQAVSLFLGGMIVGRLAGSRLVQRLSAARLATQSVILAAAGFLVFWLAANPLLAEAGLFLTGLGVANLYPTILSLAIGAAAGKTVEAGARATLASGSAILALPLVLGRLADAAGIRLAYGIVLFLLAGTLLIIQLSTWRRAPQAAAGA